MSNSGHPNARIKVNIIGTQVTKILRGPKGMLEKINTLKSPASCQFKS